MNTHGAAGPSGVDAENWRWMCTSFADTSDYLCDSLALCARRLPTTFVDPNALEAYLASRLIPLDKHPGVRPIGIGEVLRRVVGKAILHVISADIQEAAGGLQLCAGQDFGIEATIHACMMCTTRRTPRASSWLMQLMRQHQSRCLPTECAAPMPLVCHGCNQHLPSAQQSLRGW